MLVKLTYAPIDAPQETRYKELAVNEIIGNSDKLCFILINGDYVAIDVKQLNRIEIKG